MCEENIFIYREIRETRDSDFWKFTCDVGFLISDFRQYDSKKK